MRVREAAQGHARLHDGGLLSVRTLTGRARRHATGAGADAPAPVGFCDHA
ncbi:hypothetical protein [Streptomyces tubercidicus]|nr:hypothetical protein [Streptomyces tubercidicus]WAU12131.1 hypothetical protein STRTU_002437 [Streptomyces tubercidicus]